jgi:hypothetical protein
VGGVRSSYLDREKSLTSLSFPCQREFEAVEDFLYPPKVAAPNKLFDPDPIAVLAKNKQND